VEDPGEFEDWEEEPQTNGDSSTDAGNPPADRHVTPRSSTAPLNATDAGTSDLSDLQHAITSISINEPSSAPHPQMPQTPFRPIEPMTASVTQPVSSDRGPGGYNGLSPHSANGSVFYEKYGIQARVSYNWRSAFLRQCFGAASRPENRSAYGQLDASIAYDITPQLQIYAQGVNLTDAYVRDYSVLDERLLLLQNTGSRYLFGVRARF